MKNKKKGGENMPLKSFKYFWPVSIGLLLCSCSISHNEEYENFLKAEKEKIKNEQILLEKQKQVNQQEQLNLQKQREQLKKEKNLLSQKKEKIAKEKRTLSQPQKQIDDRKKEKPTILNKKKRCIQSLQSCRYVLSFPGASAWECRLEDCEGDHPRILIDSGDLASFVDIPYSSVRGKQYKRDEYGNEVEDIEEYQDKNGNPLFTRKQFYIYVDNTKWQERKYSSLKSIIYDQKGVRLQERTSEYSDDGLEAKYTKRDYIDGTLAQEEGLMFSCSYGWFAKKNEGPQCSGVLTLKDSWRAKIENNKILGKTYYSGWFKDILYTSEYEYNKDGSYIERYSDGKIEKHSADGKKI